jgi:mycoredoxin
MLTELFGTRSCPYTADLRERLEWHDVEFVEYDVESDPAALAKMRELCAGGTAVPVLTEDGRVVQVGFDGRACYVARA